MKPRSALALSVVGIGFIVTSTLVALGIYYAMRASIISLVDQVCRAGPSCPAIGLPSEGFILLPAIVGLTTLVVGTGALYDMARSTSTASPSLTAVRLKPRSALVLNLVGIGLAVTSTAFAIVIYYRMRESIISSVDQLCEVGPCLSILLPNEGFILLPAVIGFGTLVVGIGALYDVACSKLRTLS